jgi:hypothetical protein
MSETNGKAKEFVNEAMDEGKLKAEITHLASLSPVLYEAERKATAKRLNMRPRMLDEFVSDERWRQIKARLEQEAARAEQAPKRDIAAELKEAAGDLITTPNLLDRFASTIGKVLVGDTNNAKLLYLALTSRVFSPPERPVSIAIKGVSSAGKSYTVEQVLKFFPEEAFFELTGMSEKALPYMEEDLRHRFIVVYEAAGLNTDTADYHIRTLLSENRIVYLTNESTPEGVVSRKIEKEGPTGLITTTTLPSLHPENETRLMSLGVVDTQEQTQAVMDALAADAGVVIDYAPWQAFQNWLAQGECRVVVPYAPVLAKLVPPIAVRLRRDFRTLMMLIKAHALIHREEREKDSAGRIHATLDDYAAVLALVGKLFAEGLEATVPTIVRETVRAVGDLLAETGKEHVSQADLVRYLKLDRNTISYRVRKALSRGYLANIETKLKVPAKLIMADPMPEELEILPTRERLLEAWWESRMGEEGYASPQDPLQQSNSDIHQPEQDLNLVGDPADSLSAVFQQPTGEAPTAPTGQDPSPNSQDVDPTGVLDRCWSVGDDSEGGTPPLSPEDDWPEMPASLRRNPDVW